MVHGDGGFATSDAHVVYCSHDGVDCAFISDSDDGDAGSSGIDDSDGDDYDITRFFGRGVVVLGCLGNVTGSQ